MKKQKIKNPQCKKGFGGKLELFIFCLLLMAMAAPAAQAAQIKKVFRGIANFAPGLATTTVDIGSKVLPEKCIILISSNAADTSNKSHGERNFFFTAQLLGDDELQIDRGASDVNAAVSWQVVEFADGVRVQSGLTTMDSGSLTKTITLPVVSPALDIAKSVPIVTFRTTTGGDAASGYARTNEFFLAPTLSQNGTDAALTFSRLKSTVSANDKALTLAWQVVEFLTDAKVYSGAVSMSVPSVNSTQSVTNNGIDPDGVGLLPVNAPPFDPPLSNKGSNTLLFFYPKYGTGFTGEDARLFMRGAITDEKTVTFTRGYAATTKNTEVEIRFYVVDFTDGSGTSGDLGKGFKGATAATDEPTVLNVKSSTNKSPITNTTTAAHGYQVDDFVNVGGVNTNTAANGNWFVQTVPSSGAFTMKYLLNQVNGLGGKDGTAGKTSKALAIDLSPAYGTLDPTRFITLASVSATNAATVTTNHWMDDLSVMNYLYNKGTAWYLTFLRDASGRDIAVQQDYVTYEFPALTLRTPNGGEVLSVNTEQPITWSYAESVKGHDWRLEISPDGGTKYIPMTGAIYGHCGLNYKKDCTSSATLISLSEGIIPWKVPDVVGKDFKIRIVDLTDTATPDPLCRRVCDASNKSFTIRGSISHALVKSDGSTPEVLNVGDPSVSVEWTQAASIGNVTIDMDTDGDGLFGAEDNPKDKILQTEFETGPAGVYTWYWSSGIPNRLGEDNKIRIFAERDDSVQAKTSSFAIRPTIRILEPTSETRGLLGKSYTLKYCTTGTVGKVRFYLSSNGGNSFDLRLDQGGLAGASPVNLGPTENCWDNEAHWDWTIDSSLPVGTTYKIRIEKADGPAVSGVAPAAGAFGILKPSITLTEPATNVVFKSGTVNLIRWQATGGYGFNVSIQYTASWSTCQNNPSDHSCWVTIKTPDVSNLPGSSLSFIWNMTDLEGSDVGIRIQDIASADSVFDKRGPFRIEKQTGATTTTAAVPATSATISVSEVLAANQSSAGTGTTAGSSVTSKQTSGTNTGFIPRILAALFPPPPKTIGTLPPSSTSKGGAGNNTSRTDSSASKPKPSWIQRVLQSKEGQRSPGEGFDQKKIDQATSATKTLSSDSDKTNEVAGQVSEPEQMEKSTEKKQTSKVATQNFSGRVARMDATGFVVAYDDGSTVSEVRVSFEEVGLTPETAKDTIRAGQSTTVSFEKGDGKSALKEITLN